LQQADAVVSMAGYNSCAEIMQSGRPVVLMPRNRMRHEQFIRAQRLSERGLATSISGFDPPALRKAVEKALIGISAGAASPNLNGLDNFCDLVIELSAQNSAGSAMPAQAGDGSQAG
jgi:predicted glycosyltransferase